MLLTRQMIDCFAVALPCSRGAFRQAQVRGLPRCEKTVAELADIAKVLENKSLTMSFIVRQLADISVIWRSNNSERRGLTREKVDPLGPLGKNAGNSGVFPEAQGAPLGPLGKFTEGLRAARKGCAPCAPWKFLRSFWCFSRGARCASCAPWEIVEVFGVLRRGEEMRRCAPWEKGIAERQTEREH
jgi:hypothetical protein